MIFNFDFSVSFFSLHRKDEFTIECLNVGEITKILIAHNNKGRAPGWFLDRILIEDLGEHRIYEFPCYKWLAIDEADQQISRFLYPKKGAGPVATGGKSILSNFSLNDFVFFNECYRRG